MSTLIVAFPKLEEAKAVRSLLIHRGFDVAVPCTSGAQAINQADTLSDGIIICGYKLSDNMVYTELYEYKPKSFEMLLVASQNRWEDCQDNGIVCAAMPIKVNDLVSTIEMMLLLMERNNMSEQEAFRYIQKCSMDSGNTMVESATMVMGIYQDV